MENVVGDREKSADNHWIPTERERKINQSTDCCIVYYVKKFNAAIRIGNRIKNNLLLPRNKQVLRKCTARPRRRNRTTRAQKLMRTTTIYHVIVIPNNDRHTAGFLPVLPFWWPRRIVMFHRNIQYIYVCMPRVSWGSRERANDTECDISRWLGNKGEAQAIDWVLLW